MMPPDDSAWMRRALGLAAQTAALASPNPQVGCVLVRAGEVVGEGAHVYELRDHAEVVALKQAGAAARGATAYVTLEPCTHHGRTGPCADALIRAGVARCVAATLDPNPVVTGRGVARMRAGGIAVDVGLLKAEARELNEAFAWSIARGLPFVTLKAALSADGYLAPAVRTAREPFWLTGAAAREEVQRLRHGSDAILTGIGTVLADDPLLTDRTGLPRRRPLMRVVLDSRLRIADGTKLVQTVADDLWVFCGKAVDEWRRAALRARGVRVSAVGGEAGLDVEQALACLHEEGILSVLVEAGAEVNGAFLRGDLVDRVVLFYAQTELGVGSVPFAAGSAGPYVLEKTLIEVERSRFGADGCVTGLVHDPWAGLAKSGVGGEER